MADHLKIDPNEVLLSLCQREEAADTALVKNIAIPHIVLDKYISPQLFIFRSKNYLADWNCLDGSKVKVFICLVFLEKVEVHDQSFKKIRQIINLLADEQIDKQISEAKSANQIIKILSN